MTYKSTVLLLDQQIFIEALFSVRRGTKCGRDVGDAEDVPLQGGREP